MVKHIVCFKLNEGESPLKAKEVLLSMVGNVPTAKKIEVFLDELHSGRSYDVMLQVTVDSFDALNEYQNDPYHCGVVKKHMHAVAVSSIAMDFTE
ncbi:MAG: Dabb family protein [Clostridia bacterium]|nr:Dabb family protein [Clostridia bacterium]